MASISDERLAWLTAKAATVRMHTIKAASGAGGAHFGGAMSASDILTALYFDVMRYDPLRPCWADRDRFILSKGHAGIAFYAVLAEAGFFSVRELDTYNCLDTKLGQHPDMNKVAGADMSSGSLGHGLSVGAGMAIAGKLDRKNYRVFVLLGDGEIQEGMVWEAAMAAAHYKLDNLVAIVDYNRLQLDGPIEEVMGVEPLTQKWEAFGWSTKEINGHSFPDLCETLSGAAFEEGKPSVIIAHTVKGKGVPLMEGKYEWHYGAMNAEQEKKALAELGAIAGGVESV